MQSRQFRPPSVLSHAAQLLLRSVVYRGRGRRIHPSTTTVPSATLRGASKSPGRRQRWLFQPHSPTLAQPGVAPHIPQSLRLRVCSKLYQSAIRPLTEYGPSTPETSNTGALLEDRQVDQMSEVDPGRQQRAATTSANASCPRWGATTPRQAVALGGEPPELPRRLRTARHGGRVTRQTVVPAVTGDPAMSTTVRFVSAGVVLGLAAGLVFGAGFAQAGRAAAVSPSTAPSTPSTVVAGGAPVGLPAVRSGVTDVGVAGTWTSGSGPAIAYPYLGGTPDVAPDHTIVVTGVGEADGSADGSGRTAAEQAALEAALADAKAQADAIAAAAHLSITGVLSVSASIAPYGPLPLVANGSGPAVCAPGAAAGGATASAAPMLLPQPVCPPAYGPTLSVAVTIAYQIG